MPATLDRPQSRASTVGSGAYRGASPCDHRSSPDVEINREWVGTTDRTETLRVSDWSTSASWWTEIIDRLNSLLQLPDNWNGYGERAVTPAAVAAALKLLGGNLSAPTPWVVPLSSGGLQIEWHADTIDLEIEIPSSGGTASVWLLRGRDELVWSLDREGFALLDKALEEFGR